MTYAVKELFLTLQGEGAQAGRAAVFCRFSGCNLWTGRDEDRHRAVCRFCDTDFFGTDGPGGGRFKTAEVLVDRIAATWPGNGSVRSRPLVVFTGGEPALQLDESVLSLLSERGFESAIETNGTRPLPLGLDWVCMSPKAGTDLVVRSGDELKLVYPQETLPPEAVEDLNFSHLYLQPMDGPALAENMRMATAYCMRHPQWRLSLQIHKAVGIP
jgi:7-carboxy-7-deazaguanine synthase (Cx14CxxC type)